MNNVEKLLKNGKKLYFIFEYLCDKYYELWENNKTEMSIYEYNIFKEFGDYVSKVIYYFDFENPNTNITYKDLIPRFMLEEFDKIKLED